MPYIEGDIQDKSFHYFGIVLGTPFQVIRI